MSKVYQCKCEVCQSKSEHPDKKIHHQINIFLSRLDEDQRRWYVALEAEKLGHGGTKYMSTITGMNVNTIRRGRKELREDLSGREEGRIRLPGGGRKPIEKKAL